MSENKETSTPEEPLDPFAGLDEVPEEIKPLDVTTLRKGQIVVNRQMFDEEFFVQSFLRNAINAYNIESITNGVIKNNLAIIGMHPIAALRSGATEAENGFLAVKGGMDGKLPIIGVEQMTTGPHEQTPLGVSEKRKYTLDAKFLDDLEAMPFPEKIFPVDLIPHLRAELEKRCKNEDGTDKDPGEIDPILVSANAIIKRSGVHIHAWAATADSKRYLKRVIESSIIEFYRAIQKFGAKPEPYTMEPGQYNFEFGETLHGVEFTLPFILQNMNYLIDLDIQVIKNFDIGILDTQTCWFLTPSGSDEEPWVFGGDATPEES